MHSVCCSATVPTATQSLGLIQSLDSSTVGMPWGAPSCASMYVQSTTGSPTQLVGSRAAGPAPDFTKACANPEAPVGPTGFLKSPRCQCVDNSNKGREHCSASSTVNTQGSFLSARAHRMASKSRRSPTRSSCVPSRVIKLVSSAPMHRRRAGSNTTCTGRPA